MKRAGNKNPALFINKASTTALVIVTLIGTRTVPVLLVAQGFNRFHGRGPVGWVQPNDDAQDSQPGTHFVRQKALRSFDESLHIVHNN